MSIMLSAYLLWLVTNQPPMDHLVAEKATKYDVPYHVAVTVIQAESGGNNKSHNKKTGAACMMQVVSASHIKGRPTAKRLIASKELCLETGMKILAGMFRNKNTRNICDAIVGYMYGPKYIGRVSYNNKLMQRVRGIHKKLWGVELCQKTTK